MKAQLAIVVFIASAFLQCKIKTFYVLIFSILKQVVMLKQVKDQPALRLNVPMRNLKADCLQEEIALESSVTAHSVTSARLIKFRFISTGIPYLLKCDEPLVFDEPNQVCNWCYNMCDKCGSNCGGCKK